MIGFWLFAALLVVINLAVMPYFLFLLATALAAIFARRPERLPADPSSKFLIVIPAHNEQSGIATTVSELPGVGLSVLVLRRSGHRR